MNLHRSGTCSVCGAEVIFEHRAPRTYEPITFAPHYCDPSTVSARLRSAQEAYLVEPAVEPPSEPSKPSEHGRFGGVAL